MTDIEIIKHEIKELEIYLKNPSKYFRGHKKANALLKAYKFYVENNKEEEND